MKSSKYASSLFYIHMALPLLLYAPLKRCNLPCMKILSDSCNGIWLSSWGDIFSTATVLRLTPLSSLGRRAPWSRGRICPGVISVTLYTMTWFDNQLTVPSLNKTRTIPNPRLLKSSQSTMSSSGYSPLSDIDSVKKYVFISKTINRNCS